MLTRTRILAGFIALVAMSALIAAGCGSGSGDSGSEREQRLTAAIGLEPSTLDPALVADVDATFVVNQAFSGLTKVVGEDGEIVPDLAEGLGELSDDGSTVTYTLREGLMWSNGDPLTAEDVVWSWLRALDPELEAYFSYQMWDIVGAEDYSNCSGGAACKKAREAVGITAVDERTVEVQLENPVPWFDQLVALSVFMPVHRATVEEHGEAWTEPANIVSSGAFVVEEVQAGESIALARNGEYWDAENVALESVDLQIVEEQGSGYRLFQQEKLDAAFPNTVVGPNDIEEAKTDERFVSTATPALTYLYFNTKAPELENKLVRQAIAMAVDRTKITDDILRAGQGPTVTLTSGGLPGYEVIETGTQDFIQPDAEPDTDRAMQLLEEAGWDEGTEVSMYYSTETDSSQLIAESIQEDLGAVGIDLKLVPQSDTNTLYDVATPPIDSDVHIMQLGWVADYLDSKAFYEQFMCDNPFNATQYCNEDLDALIEAASVEIDDTARFEIEKEIEAMLSGPEGDFPAATLYRDTNLTMVQPWVDGFEFSPLGVADLAAVEITDES